jgi:hypothetical protein
MAKLKAPLLSLGASGQIGKSIVYFPWKGINAARQHVVPANPKSAGQVIQRDFLKDAVAKIHVALARTTFALVSADKSAYSLLASAQGITMTWFNSAVKVWNDCKVAGFKACIYSAGLASNTLHTGAVCQVYFNEEGVTHITNAKFYIGLSKTSMLQSAVASITSGNFATNGANPFTNLSLGETYYFQFRPDTADPYEGADSGIYHFKAT